MRNILVQYYHLDVLIKTWRLSDQGKPISFGSSKKSDLPILGPDIKGLNGLFKYKDNQWYYSSLVVGDDETIKIDKECFLYFHETTLKITPFESQESVFKGFERSQLLEQETTKHAYQLCLVYHNRSLLESRILKLGENFVCPYNGDGIEVKKYTVYLSDAEALRRMNIAQLYDPSVKRIMGFVSVAALFILTMILFMPESKDAAKIAENYMPPKVQELKFVPQKKRTTPVEQVTSIAASSTEKSNTAPAAKSSALQNSRLSQLIGKISKSAQKSSNIVIAKGVPAGEQLTAGVQIASSGKNWGQEKQSGKVLISTAGVAGGRNVAALGRLAVGKTGNSGAELIEEEAEVVGGLDRDVIAGVIRANLGQVLYCYERQLSASPDLFGKVSVKFTIDGGGLVETQKIAETSLRSQSVESCILNRISGWKFPSPMGGTKVVVTYPFLFKSTN